MRSGQWQESDVSGTQVTIGVNREDDGGDDFVRLAAKHCETVALT